MRATLVVLATAAALVASGSAPAGASGTALTVSYWARGIGKGEPTRWRLRCNPARGTLARPGVACRRLAQARRSVFEPVPRNAVCTEIYGGPQVARVIGTFSGGRLWATFTRQNGCHISRWDALAPWLIPRASVAG